MKAALRLIAIVVVYGIICIAWAVIGGVTAIHFLFLGAAFFAFHLLFAYTVDRLPIPEAFALASVVSVALVVSYLRLVVSPRFAFVEAGIAQLVYRVGFSLAHVWEGFTGFKGFELTEAKVAKMLAIGRSIKEEEAAKKK